MFSNNINFVHFCYLSPPSVGTFEVEIVIQLLKTFPSVACTVVEPSGERIESYKQLVEKRKSALHGATFEWRAESLDEFYEVNRVNKRQFHFLSLIHSCYFMKHQELENHLRQITGFLYAGGQALIMHDAGM